MSQIRSKRQFYTLWRAGVLGNRTLLWDSVSEALDWLPRLDKFGFREIGKTGGGAWELSPRAAAEATAERWKAAGRTFVIDGSVPNDKAVLQGEVCRTELGLQSFLCVREELARDIRIALRSCYALLSNPEGWREPLGPGLPPMRKSMGYQYHRHRGYLQTKLLLDAYLDASSRDDLEILLEQYPDAAIEFTTFSINVGVLPHRNTIFWETRNYILLLFALGLTALGS